MNFLNDQINKMNVISYFPREIPSIRDTKFPHFSELLTLERATWFVLVLILAVYLLKKQPDPKLEKVRTIIIKLAAAVTFLILAILFYKILSEN